MQVKTEINLSSSTQDMLNKAQDIGLLERWDWDKSGYQIIHPDGDSITFDTTENDLVSYLEGLLKSWDLIQCGIVDLGSKKLEKQKANLVKINQEYSCALKTTLNILETITPDETQCVAAMSIQLAKATCSTALFGE